MSDMCIWHDGHHVTTVPRPSRSAAALKLATVRAAMVLAACSPTPSTTTDPRTTTTGAPSASPALKPIDQAALQAVVEKATKEMLVPGAVVAIRTPQGSYTAAVGTTDQLIDTLRQKYSRPVPGGDLLMSNIYDQLMPEVTNAKDLGSGVIDGVECDHLAFRTKDVDWQIWVAQGDRPYPCRYVITSTQVNRAPGYSIDLRDWNTNAAITPASFAFVAPANAKKLEPGELKDFDELPAIFRIAKAKRAGLDLRLLPSAVSEFFVSTVEAVVGRPLTPVSVSGVARRTSRRCSADVYDC